MVRDNRVKQYTFSSTDLIGVANGSPNSKIDIYSQSPLNGVIQQVAWQAGNHTATGSLWIRASGWGSEGDILTFTSGTDTHNIGENWVVFPRATTVRTNMTTISGANGYNDFAQIPINTVVRVIVSGVGVNKSGGELSIGYI